MVLMAVWDVICCVWVVGLLALFGWVLWVSRAYTGPTWMKGF